jgi:DNA-binding transcriptional regulator LsrR (DeoR family)
MPSQKNSNPNDEFDLLAQVAKSYYIENKNQSQIAEACDISPSTVSRLLSRAREEGIVRIAVVFPQRRNNELEDALRQKFALQDAIVARISTGVLDDQTILHEISKVAAPYIDALIKPGLVIGVSASSSVAALIRALKPLATPRYVTVVQLMGEFEIQHSSRHSAEITRLMAEMYVGTNYYLNAPTFVEDPDVAEALWRTRGISEVLPFYNRLDMMLVGVGPLRGSPLETNGLLRSSHIRQLEAAGAVGDTCGHFFSEDGHLVDDAYSGKVIAIGWDQLRRCPQVVAVAAGNKKVEALRALLNGRIIHILATDENTAYQTLDM